MVMDSLVQTQTPLAKMPLVLDLDGTFIRNDLSHELLLLAVCYHPLATLLILFKYLGQKQRLKAALFDLVGHRINVATLPYNDAVIAQAKAAKAQGQAVILCSGSDERLVRKIASQFKFIDDSFGSTQDVNLTSARKAAFLKSHYPKGFDYVGNARADIAVWQDSQNAFAVNPPKSAHRVTSKIGTPVQIIDKSQGGLKAVIKALRLHQWVKNLLLFLIPILIIDRISVTDYGALLLGFLAMGVLASATYVLNDLVDIQHDRAHSRKKFRPFASGALPVPAGVLIVMMGLALAAVMAWSINAAFFAVLCLYLVLTLAYSFYIKRVAIFDVLTLANLFLIRVAAGGAILSEPVSPWLACFIVALFLSLSLVKRYTEVNKQVAIDSNTSELIPGRGYRRTDGPIILGFGIMSLAMTLVAFSLYGLIAENPALTSPYGLFAVGIILTFWMMRMWLLTYRGEMNDDPVLFAIKDPLSLVLGLLSVIIVLVEKGALLS
ncbi:UbiA family prenyltransferase [Fretibacter rubidus]|uniref:UbiA family prenyltransferase n=1 Tax=Fretibacter rubidus TaxID=570162 RepID=UPI00352BBB11